MNETTLIQLKRFGDINNVRNAELRIGEPALDYTSQKLYIGTTQSNTTLGELDSEGKYFRPVNSKYPIKTEDIAQDAITTNTIKNQNVTTSKLSDGAVTTVKINNGAVTNDKIADKTITYDKLLLADGIIPYSKVAHPTTFDANAITGHISADNLPVDYTAPRATSDKYGNDITKNYANLLALETAGGVTRLVLRPLSRQAGDQTNLGVIEPSALAKAIQGYLPQAKLNDLSGSITWKQIVDPPSVLDMTAAVGSPEQPIYYNAGSKRFFAGTSYTNFADKYVKDKKLLSTTKLGMVSIKYSGGKPQPVSLDGIDNDARGILLVSFRRVVSDVPTYASGCCLYDDTAKAHKQYIYGGTYHEGGDGFVAYVRNRKIEFQVSGTATFVTSFKSVTYLFIKCQ